MKKERGITLVALVITVIIMLILAGVALSLITGEEGLFARANHSAQKYKDASQVEADKVDSVVSELEKYSGGTTTPPTVSEPTLITKLALDGTLKVGAYIEYDAGKWTDVDLAKITTSITAYGGSINSTVSDGETGNRTLPTVKGEFGGFEIGDSRNSNSMPYIDEGVGTPRTEGWRIWDIDEDTGEVTIIHAGHPEAFKSNKGDIDVNILRNRDCSMYENKYAKENSAHFLIGWEAAEWYTKNCGEGTTYELESYDEDVDKDGNTGESSFYWTTFVSASENPVIEVLENGSYYWLSSRSKQNQNFLFYVNPQTRVVHWGLFSHPNGVRPLVTLKSDILLESDGQTDGGWTNWKIVGSAN